jgi:hypothetical protein
VLRPSSGWKMIPRRRHLTAEDGPAGVTYQPFAKGAGPRWDPRDGSGLVGGGGLQTYTEQPHPFVRGAAGP